jgi:transposase InsO family protein
MLKTHNIRCSMSRKGNCWDNAVAESFFHTLKTELVHHEDYQSRDAARTSIFEYIEGCGTGSDLARMWDGVGPRQVIDTD